MRGPGREDSERWKAAAATMSNEVVNGNATDIYCCIFQVTYVSSLFEAHR